MAELGTLPLLGVDAWKNIGKCLSINDLIIQLIDEKFSTPIKKQKELFRTYLKKCPNPSWRDVLYSLVSVGKEDVAKNVAEVFELPQEILPTVQSSLKRHSLPVVGIDEVDFIPSHSDRVSKTELHFQLDPLLPISMPKLHEDSDDSATTKGGHSPLAIKSRTAQIPATLPRVGPDGDALPSHSKNTELHDPTYFNENESNRPAEARRRVVADGDASPLPSPKLVEVIDWGESSSLPPLEMSSTDTDRKTKPRVVHVADDGSEPESHNQRDLSLSVAMLKSHDMPVETKSLTVTDGGRSSPTLGFNPRSEPLSLNVNAERNSDVVRDRARRRVEADCVGATTSRKPGSCDHSTLGEKTKPKTDVVREKAKPHSIDDTNVQLSPSPHAFHSPGIKEGHSLVGEMTRRESVMTDDGTNEKGEDDSTNEKGELHKEDTRSNISSDVYHSAEEMSVDDLSDIAVVGRGRSDDIPHYNPPEPKLKKISLARDLLEAVMNKDLAKIRKCIREDWTLLNQPLKVESGHTGLHLAAIEGSKEVAGILLELKAALSVKDLHGCTSLHLAASYGNYEVAKMILAVPGHSSVHTSTKDGTPLLLDPASKGFSMICELLLENGADPLTENRDGVSPLYTASENGHKDVVRTLLKFGADPTKICRQTSKTPLQAAIDHGHIGVLKLLMKALSSLDKRNDELFTCKTVEDVQKSMKDGAKVDALKADGSTPLIVHTSRGNEEVVEELINQGANVDKQNNDGWSALMMASRNGNMEIVQVLISAGAIPDLKNREGLTALMCATLSEHVKIVKELLLAKADPNLKIKNGRTALEIAEQRGSRELITAMKRHTMSTASSGNDPLFGLLGSYLELKKQTGAQRQAVKSVAKRKGASSLLLPRLPQAQAQADEATSDRKKLNEQYKRISELETRIHDLSLQIHMQPPEDTDLSYLERKRLEDEFRKLKELKLKAEKYAIEAKQTAQRLSAENSKLREDLSRERKHNEMTRSNIIRELEERSSRDALTGEKMAIRAEMYDREVKGKAYQLAHTSPQMQVGVRKDELTMKDVKETMFNQSFKVNLPIVKIIIVGKTGTGKSALINTVVGLRDSSSTFTIGDGAVSTDVATDETRDIITLHDKVHESHLVIKSSTGDNFSIQKLSLALAQGLTRAHRVPSFAESESSLDQSSMFSNTTVNKHFNEAYMFAKKLTRQLESKGSLDLLGNGLLSFVDLANTGESKTANEVFNSLADHCRKHILILNLLNLERDTPESLTVPPDFYDSAFPHETSRPVNVRNFKSALQSIKHSVSMLSQASTTPKVLLVGTHKDKLPERRLGEAKHCLKQVAMSYAEEVGVMDAISPRIEFVDATNEGDCKRVQDRIMQIVQDGDEFQVKVPVKFLFFQSYLQAMNRMFISRRKLVEEAHKCDMTDEEEIETFLILFNTCGSIVYSSNGEIPTLKDYIILNPNKFFKALDKLHDVDMKAISDNPELIKDTYETKLGFLSENLASHLWPEEGEGKLTQAHFIISVLRDLKFALPKSSLRIDASVDGGKMVYFLPTLRPECDTTELTGDSSSLFITHSNTVLPFPVATDVLLQLLNRLGESLTFEPKPYHNTLTFKWHDAQEQRDAEVTVRFTSDHVEVAVGFPTHAPRISTATKLFSKLKTAVVEMFQQLSGRIKGLEYELAVVCPHSLESCHQSGNLPPHSIVSKPVHYVAFTSRRDERLVCQTCREVVTVEKLSWARQLWTQVACGGTSISTRGGEGYLSPGHISLIAQSLASGHSQETLQYLLELLGLSSEDMFKNGLQESMEGLLYQLMLTWKRRNPVNSLKKLAKILQTGGCLQEAIKLDPDVLDNDTNTTSKMRALTDCQLSLIASHVQESDLKQLIQSLGPSPSIKSDSTSLTTRFESLRLAVRECKVQGKGGDIRIENVVRKLREFGYNNLAFTIDSGTMHI